MLRNNADAGRCSYFELGLPVITRNKDANNIFCFFFYFSASHKSAVGQ